MTSDQAEAVIYQGKIGAVVLSSKGIPFTLNLGISDYILVEAGVVSAIFQNNLQNKNLEKLQYKVHGPFLVHVTSYSCPLSVENDFILKTFREKLPSVKIARKHFSGNLVHFSINKMPIS